MNKSYKHLPKDKRKKILLITDDIRVTSGVATVGKEIVLKTCHHYNWVQLAGAVKHPNKGKRHKTKVKQPIIILIASIIGQSLP